MRRTVCFYMLVSNILILLQGLRSDQASTTVAISTIPVEDERNETPVLLILEPSHELQGNWNRCAAMSNGQSRELKEVKQCDSDVCVSATHTDTYLAKNKVAKINTSIRRQGQAARQSGISDMRRKSERVDRRNVRDLDRTTANVTPGNFGSTRIVTHITGTNEKILSRINNDKRELHQRRYSSRDEPTNRDANRKRQRNVPGIAERQNRRVLVSRQIHERRETNIDTRNTSRNEKEGRLLQRRDTDRNEIAMGRRDRVDRLPVSRRSSKQKSVSRIDVQQQRSGHARRRLSSSLTEDVETQRHFQRNERNLQKYRSQERIEMHRASDNVIAIADHNDRRVAIQRRIPSERNSMLSQCLNRSPRCISANRRVNELQTTTGSDIRKRHENTFRRVPATAAEESRHSESLDERRRLTERRVDMPSKSGNRRGAETKFIGTSNTDIREVRHEINIAAARDRRGLTVDKSRQVAREGRERNRNYAVEKNRRDGRVTRNRRIERRNRYDHDTSNLSRRDREASDRINASPRLIEKRRTESISRSQQVNLERRVDRMHSVDVERNYRKETRVMQSERNGNNLRHKRDIKGLTGRWADDREQYRTDREIKQELSRRYRRQNHETSLARKNVDITKYWNVDITKYWAFLSDAQAMFGLKPYIGEFLSFVDMGSVSRAVLLCTVGMMGQSFWNKTV